MAAITPLALSRHRPSAFVDFYRAHAEPLLLFFVRRTYDVDVAADLTSETFAQAYQSRGRFRGNTDEEAAGWLYAIAHRQLARYRHRGLVERRALQRLGWQVPELEDDEYERIEVKAGLASLRAELADAADRLAPEARIALWLRVVDELPFSEVGARLSISEEAARARVSRALRTLRHVTRNQEALS